VRIIILLKKLKNIFQENELDIQKLKDLSNKLYFGEEGAGLLNGGKNKKNKKAEPLTMHVINKLNRKRKILKFWDKFKLKYLIYVIWGLGIILVLLIFPIIYNKIFNIPSKNVAGETSDWISFYGSYLGGLFGGLLTLIGVRLTISHNNKQQFIKDFPQKDIALRDIITEIKKLMERIKECKNEKELLSCLFEFSSKEIELKEKAIMAGPTTYKILDKLFEFVNDGNTIKLLYIMNSGKDGSIISILTDYINIFSKLRRGLFNEYEKSAV
jgi:hypothetical protein